MACVFQLRANHLCSTVATATPAVQNVVKRSCAHNQGLVEGPALVVGLAQLDDHIAAEAADDVLAFAAMEVCGVELPLRVEDQLLRVGLGVARIILMPVAQGEEIAADVQEIETSKIGHIPTEHAVAYFVIFGPGGLGAFWGDLNWQNVAKRVSASPSGSCEGSRCVRDRPSGLAK